MLLKFVQQFETSVGRQLMMTTYDSDIPLRSDIVTGDLFLISEMDLDNIGVFKKDVVEVDDAAMELFRLPETSHPASMQSGRVLKYITQTFYRYSMEQFYEVPVFLQTERMKAAADVYRKLTGMNTNQVLYKSHYQHVDSEEVRVPRLPDAFPVKRILTHYPNEGITQVRWNLGDDRVDFRALTCGKGKTKGKDLVDLVMTMTVHRSYERAPIQTLQQIVDSNDLHGQAVEFFYHRRRLMMEY
jgi:hypothetical protein